MKWLIIINCFLLSFTGGLLVLNAMAFRRLIRLNELLQHIVVKAWVMRHAPIWVPWCAVRRLEFRVEVDPLPPTRRKRENWGR